MNNFHAEGVRWDLSDLYDSRQDPKIQSHLEAAGAKAREFEKKYRPLFAPDRVAGLPLAELLADYKDIASLTTKLGVFSHLSFAEKTTDPAAGAFMQKIQVALTDIQSHLLFFEVEWNRLGETAAAQLLQDPRLEPDRHFLEKLRAWASHTLSEGEEKVMAVKSNTAGQAFSRLFDEVVNGIPFHVQLNGRKEKKTEGEVLALLHSPDRAERQKASDSLAEGLTAHTHLLTYIYNMILADHRADMKLRGFRHPMDPMNLSNEIALPDVLNLVKSVKGAYPLAMRYYRLKKNLLGLNAFLDYDRYAPIGQDGRRVSFDECKKIVLSGYYAFSEEAGRITEQFFDKRWIDAEVREGKQGGGFACSTTPDLHPYILVNYTGSLRDVMTVAHELGHGLHQFMARKAGVLESGAPLTMAETASVFGEMLIFERIVAGEKDPAERLNLLCGKIDDDFATVYRQIAMTDFELRAHEAGLKEGELPHERLSDFWMEANAEFYGDSVGLTENYRHGWKYIPHFVHTPFYCYAYAFAQLFVLSLFQRYKRDKQAFVPKYFRMLELGGSRKPAEIAGLAGLDLHREDFWKDGLDRLEELVSEAEALAPAVNRQARFLS